MKTFLKNIFSKKKKYDLTEEEVIKAKENCFILLGKTGTGKTSLLNLIYGDDIGKVGYESQSETKTSSYYCIKQEINNNTFLFSIMDTPGLYDSNDLQNDEIMKDNTKDLISKENLKIKGILFASNFQNKRFDYSEIDSLFQYNAFFPLKDFWKHIILIFTHYYGDPDGDSKEEIKDKSNENLSPIFSKLMERIKEVSTPIKFEELERIYVNIHSRVKTEKHLKDNEEYKKEIITKIYKFSQLEPMYNKFCFFKFKNVEVEKYREYLFHPELVLFLDENNQIINKQFKMMYTSSKDNIKEKDQIEINMVNCEINSKGNLSSKSIIKNCSISDYKFSTLGGSISIPSMIGAGFTIIPYPILGYLLLLGFGLGICLIMKNCNDVRDKETIMQQKKKQIIKDLNIKNLIEKEIIQFMQNNNDNKLIN